MDKHCELTCSDETLIEKVRRGDPEADTAIIERACVIARGAYKGKTVAGGRPLLEHGINVACILADYQLDSDCVAAGLLHNLLPYDGDTSKLKAELGPGLFSMLEHLASLNVLRFSPDEAEQTNQLRQMFIAMAKDVRIIMVKLANRLDIMRHLDTVPPGEREIYARETLEIFAALAHRLGVSQLKGEIEDLAFQWLYPDEFKKIKDNHEALRVQREDSLRRIIEELKELFKSSGVNVYMTGRSKHLFSMYKKMVRQDILFSELFDILAVRVIVEKEEECYQVLSMLHTNWTPVPGTFDDYIQEPKSNGYRSLHTVVVGPGKLPVEIQIRTWEMHQTAEYGVAAHWKYKEEVGGGRVADHAASWIRQVVDDATAVEDPKRFLERISLDQFEDRVFVLTPKGRVLTLPQGSTPVDAAYAIHTEIGHRCTGARINNRIASLDTQLHNGDVVDIITGKTSRPSRDWLKLARSQGAKQKIRAWFKKENRQENIEEGRELLHSELDRAGLKRKDLIDKIGLGESVKASSLKNEDDLLASIGCGDISVETVVNRIRKKYRELLQKEEIEIKPRKAASSVRRKKQDVMVEGLSDVMVSFSKCCYPLPDDDIIGFVSSGRGINIHRKNCPNIQSFVADGKRIVPVSWGRATPDDFYFAEIEILSLDRIGLLNDIMAVISEVKLHLSEVKSKVLKDTSLLTHLRVEVSRKEQVQNLINHLNRIDDVISARRKT